ncbi:MAG: NAD(P) transhydrogenase subunit alpha [Planctomycetota bacterium]|nr:MAG: NAD(P) transhydrogenase subunit alpha [Planctomycetota bacterium]
MHIGVVAHDGGDPRLPISPTSVGQLLGLGASISIQSGIGQHCQWSDADWSAAGAQVESDRSAILAGADMLVSVRPPSIEDLRQLRPGSITISFLDPFNQRDLIEAAASAQVSCLSLEMVPRSTIAQKMDALSSQHSLAGYYMVLLAAERLDRILPMMTTPSGTLQPARVFIIGAGVAGLQAIATAKRLGARVTAFDTRPEVAEQVESLGGRFLNIDLGRTGSTEQGYATALSEEQLAAQQAGMTKACAESDIVITTAQLFGRPAPQVISQDMVSAMRPGSIIIDYAVSSGGNVAGSRADEEVVVDGVRIIGLSNYPGQVAHSATLMLANNIAHMIRHGWDEETKTFSLTKDEETLSSCLITHAGEVVNPTIRGHYGLPTQKPEESIA